MNEAKGAPDRGRTPTGWRDPATGTCYIDTNDEAAIAEASNENVAGAMPDAMER